MNTQTIFMCVVALLIGMLVANMLQNVCGCKKVEGFKEIDESRGGTSYRALLGNFIDDNQDDEDNSCGGSPQNFGSLPAVRALNDLKRSCTNPTITDMLRNGGNYDQSSAKLIFNNTLNNFESNGGACTWATPVEGDDIFDSSDYLKNACDSLRDF